MLRGIPSLAVEEGDVGDAGVGEQVAADYQDIVAGAALCKQPVECLAVGTLVGVVAVVGGY